ncbi:hypothetical protein ACVQEO_07285 [Pasteurella multocida]
MTKLRVFESNILISTTTQRLADTILNHAYHAILQEGKPMLGLYELLHFLKARHIKMAVSTSSLPQNNSGSI